jgi:L-threonylcarbamoyladenylate synthase
MTITETIVGLDIDHAAALLRSDNLVAIPTETVYGLAANMFSERAVQQVFEVKRRPNSNPLIVHVACQDHLRAIVKNIPSAAKILIDAFSPGPLTLLLDKKTSVSDSITAGHQTVAVRIPGHPIALSLLNKLSFPLVAPSANPYTYISPTKAEHVKEMLDGSIRYVLDGGPCEMGIESTIIGFPKGIPTIYRVGAISLEEIEAKIGIVRLTTSEQVVAPGMHLKHYCPHTKLMVSDNPDEDINICSNLNICLITYNTLSNILPKEQQILLCEQDDFKVAAAGLYAALHTADARGYDLIIARKFPETGIGISINDRLERAKIQ